MKQYDSRDKAEAAAKRNGGVVFGCSFPGQPIEWWVGTSNERYTLQRQFVERHGVIVSNNRQTLDLLDNSEKGE